MKTLLFIASLATDSLPPLEMLFHSIDSFYLLKTETELAEFQISKKGEWLKYVPSVGLTYTLDGRPRPAISFSSSVIYRARKDRQTVAAKRRSIIGKNLLAAEALKAKSRKWFCSIIKPSKNFNCSSTSSTSIASCLPFNKRNTTD